jgi:hypothetical protein
MMIRTCVIPGSSELSKQLRSNYSNHALLERVRLALDGLYYRIDVSDHENARYGCRGVRGERVDKGSRQFARA